MSESTLKGLFIAVGALGVYIFGAGVYNGLDYMTWSMLFGTLLFLLVLGGLAIAVGCLLCGFKYDEYLPKRQDDVEKGLMANLGIILGSALLFLILGRFSLSSEVLPLIDAGLTGYLLHSLKNG